MTEPVGAAVAGGYFVNLTDDADDTAVCCDGAAYSRLAAVKKSYDPTNLLPLNSKLKPVV